MTRALCYEDADDDTAVGTVEQIGHCVVDAAHLEHT